VNNDATPLERPKALEGKRFPDRRGSDCAEGGRTRRGSSEATWTATPLEEIISFAALANPAVSQNRNATGSGVGAVREIDNRTSLIVDPPDGKILP
jgi:hypothetical protein